MKIPEILLVETFHKPGSLASVLSVIADERLAIEHLQSLRREQGRTLWEITVEFDEQASPDFYARIDALPNARFVGKSDRVFNRHRGGKIHMQPTLAITSQQILRDIYTPGVARVCLAIKDDPAKAALYTNRPNTVAVVTNGTAVLGLGDIGPLAGLPVMEGKAALFAALVGITAVPILVDSQDPGAHRRDHRRDRAFVRRHPARGHRRAGVLCDRGRTGAAPVHPRAARRPARHGRRRARRADQCDQARRPDAVQRLRVARSGWARPVSASRGCCARRACSRCSAPTCARRRSSASGRWVASPRHWRTSWPARTSSSRPPACGA